ncbi:hypothetical protein ACP4OV_012269 [Aristida adscensionis]
MPERLTRAALACKRWCRLVSDPGFRRRFRERHRTPPLLGVLLNSRDNDGRGITRFVPKTSSFLPPRPELRGWWARDSRHGRVLLHRQPWRWRHPFQSAGFLAVWEPIADELRELPAPPRRMISWSWNVAVLCAAMDCDHHDCSRGHFLVVLAATDFYGRVFESCVYSSEANAWSEPTSAAPTHHCQLPS